LFLTQPTSRHLLAVLGVRLLADGFGVEPVRDIIGAAVDHSHDGGGPIGVRVQGGRLGTGVAAHR
jgi:hypothetical protein